MEKFQRDIEDLRLFRCPKRRREKVYGTRFNPLNLPDSEFRRKYRFTKENMLKIVEIVQNDLEVDARGGAIPVQLQVMAAVRCWAGHEVTPRIHLRRFQINSNIPFFPVPMEISGNPSLVLTYTPIGTYMPNFSSLCPVVLAIQDDTANIHGFSQQTMSRITKKVAIALASKSNVYIKMPTTPEDQAQVISEFSTIAGISDIIGAIDCVHTKIRKVSGENGQLFINGKGNYSIYNQVVCGPNLKMFDIVCHWPGSTPKVRIFSESSIKQRFEANEFKGNLIGDGGYPSLRYLLTPVPTPTTRPETDYNSKHIWTRNVVERCFGLWKGKFRILLEVMRGSYDTIKATIIACAVLHNLSIEWNDVQDEDYVEIETEEPEEYMENENMTQSIF